MISDQTIDQTVHDYVQARKMSGVGKTPDFKGGGVWGHTRRIPSRENFKIRCIKKMAACRF